MRLMDCARSWHNFVDPHHHLLLMMVFDYPLAFHHKKGKYILRAFCFYFQGESYFLVGVCGVV